MDKIINSIIDYKIECLATAEQMLECLQVKLSLMNIDRSSMNEYEKNENDILRLETVMKLNKVKNIVESNRNDLQENYDRLISELNFEDLNIE